MHMRKISTICLVIFLSFTLVLAACNSGNNAGNNPNNIPGNDGNNPSNTDPGTNGNNDGQPQGNQLAVNTELKGEIEVWTWSPQLYEVLLPGFNKFYPNIKVNIVNLPDTPVKLKTALAAGTGAP